MLGLGYGPWDSAWREMDRLRNEFDRLLGGLPRYETAYPPVNLWSGEDKLVLTAELAGVKPEDLDISVEGDVVTLRGTRNAQREETRTYHRAERSSGQFLRTVELPYRVDADKVDAKLANGVLRLTLPRTEAERPKRIEVTSS